MDERIVHKFINKIKIKMTKKKPVNSAISEYAFSVEEIEDINKQNKQKIQELKQDIFSKKKEKTTTDKKNDNEVLSQIETKKDEIKAIDPVKLEEPIQEQSKQSTTEVIQEEIKEDIKEDVKEEVGEEQQLVEEKGGPQNSFINLSREHQQLVMDKWNEIQSNKIDKDIIDGKDLLNHNYTITYADEAAKFIHNIRKDYEIVVCYLIGFNNEKQGIYDKTIFSDKIDNEWKYLSNYIKILEKIRNFRSK